MSQFLTVRCCLAVSLLALIATLRAEPPFSGTIFVDGDIITETDPTTFVSIVAAGRGNRVMFDRRVNNWITANAYLFDATYSDGLSIEVQVNPEFDEVTAAVEAETYAIVIGRLPKALRKDVETVWIHQGLEPFGGGNNNLLIHTEQGLDYAVSGILEETLVHEACHTSLDADYADAAGWLAAQASDGEFISTYARDNPTREDIAESFLLYLALRYRPERIDASLRSTIESTIPARIAFFDSLSLEFAPVTLPESPQVRDLSFDSASASLTIRWESEDSASYSVDYSADLVSWDPLSSEILSQGESTEVTIPNVSLGQRGFFRVRRLP
jgi:hypothetical protein